MKQWLSRFLVIALVLGLGFWAWRVFFPSPEKVIRKRLNEIADLASFGVNEAPLAKFANTSKLVSYFTPDIEISLDSGGRAAVRISGRDELAQRLHAARSMTSLSVKFPDINVAVDKDKDSAVADVTVRAKVQGERDDYIEELKLSFKRDGRDWLISRVEVVKVLL